VHYLDGRPVSAWLDDLCVGRDDVRGRAVRVFRDSGAGAVPGLISVIQTKPSPLTRWLAARPAVSQRLPSPLREWAETRPHMDALRQAWAIRMCSQLGPQASPAHPALIAALDDPRLRGSAAVALARTRVDPQVGVPLLVPLLHDPQPGVRSQAALALGLYGPAAAPAVPALRAAEADPAETVQSSARLGLAMILTPEKVESIGEGGYRLRP
jgi:HEAT repeat protein